MRRIILAIALIACPTTAHADTLSIGVAIGEPSGVTARYTLQPDKLHVDAAIGTGTLLAGLGPEVHAGVAFEPTPKLPLFVGLGARYYRHDSAASVDELPDTHLGVRAAVGATYALGEKLTVFGEVAPGYDFYRSDSCSLMSGVNSVCPHVMSTRWFVQAMVGVRWTVR